MPSLASDIFSSNYRRRFTNDTLFQLITQENNMDDETRSSSLNVNKQTNTYANENSTDENLVDNDLRHLWYLLSQMIRKRLLKLEPCLLPELGAFVVIDHSSADNQNILRQEPFFVLDTTFARRHRLSRIKKPNLSSALSLSLEANGHSTYIEPNTTLSSFNMQTLDYVLLQKESGLTREQLMIDISQLFGIIDKEIHPHGYCDLEFPQLGNFRISFGLAIFDFSDAFLDEFKLTLGAISTLNNK
ncbi:unnamed protein product [Rotaria magnacalcarata]|uniref:CCDC81 HU domain-containing protein n=1 Tax=Rotaria magnacalcarata TaxID=392030 RepID=A0A815WJJ3_9BILA|nr:unnamed protein product [Rotaria magnacalcarata]CAF1544900.1 unnamed protein product [Rotaria magnacalcarata]CAF2017471.1 unnamed protein product [Rotaria magnacalcarata]CAF2021701.1 unnamed protein product [Rotaria magnacalcarata]CAF2140354.1 unnamed protein product [Rotaria magnacalcarata]